MGVTIIDGFDVEKIDQNQGVVTVTGTNNIAFSAASLGETWAHNLFSRNNSHLLVSAVSWALGE